MSDPDLPLWPFPVRQPVSEVLEWQTDVLACAAAEQRLALRAAPRESLTYTHLLDAGGLARAAALARAGYLGDGLLPLWHQAGRAATDLAADDSVIFLDTAAADYRAPGEAIVALDGGEALRVAVAAVWPDRLELSSPVGAALTRPLVAPARRAFLTAPVSIERRRQSLGSVTASFALRDGADLGTSADPAATSHLGLAVLTDPAVLRQPLAASLAQSLEIIDNGFGPLVAEPLLNYPQERCSLTLIDRGRSAIWSRRRWLHRLRGRQGAFWLPSWGRELRLQAAVPANATSMIVAPLEDLTLWPGRQVMFERTSGPICRAITAASYHALGARLSIAAPGITIAAATPVHLLTRMRLDTDRIEFEHFASRTEFSLALISVPA
ncbi:hypothetical protein [Rhodobacter ferrooxidans]|uniref:Uncharacterized protein n=1 Tax=Rhodobacter ferrooxidans TaxID=371731 RepID=C8S4Q4_9RHOB|nr:hypothetical protein [Rhodobacter sp. SW2]EEW24053.1 hypothetical protein Rsw2DRAFT_3032 [Rhodobacter sp. SW2]